MVTNEKYIGFTCIIKRGHKMEKKKWFTNEIQEKCCKECPEGWHPGRLKNIWENAAKRMRESNPMHTLSEEQLKARAQKIHEYNINKTPEQVKHKSEAISAAKKDKYKGSIPWNKGKKGVQAAWNKGKHLSEEQKKKISETKLNKSAEQKAEISRKISETHKGKPSWNKGKSLGPWTEERRTVALTKQYETKSKNNSFNTSKPEENYYLYLCERYGVENVLRQYRDSRYPFNCDFYIRSEDLFIELNLSWTHNDHPFDSSNPDDIRLLKRWQEKAKESEYYKNAIYTWTQLDVKKQQVAKDNNLNYKMIYVGDLYD